METILTITKDNKVINTITYEGLEASLQLSKVLIWKQKNSKGVKVWGLINKNGLQEIKAVAHVGNDTDYNYHFMGEELEILPRF